MSREGDTDHWVSAKATVLIRRPSEVVFAFVANAENDVQWMPRFGQAKRITPGPIRVGTRFLQSAIHFGAPIEGEWEITEYVSNQRIEGRSVSGPFRFTGGYICEELEIGTQLTKFASVYLPSALSSVSNPVASILLGKEFDNALRRLQTILERGTVC